MRERESSYLVSHLCSLSLFPSTSATLFGSYLDARSNVQPYADPSPSYALPADAYLVSGCTSYTHTLWQVALSLFLTVGVSFGLVGLIAEVEVAAGIWVATPALLPFIRLVDHGPPFPFPPMMMPVILVPVFRFVNGVFQLCLVFSWLCEVDESWAVPGMMLHYHRHAQRTPQANPPPIIAGGAPLRPTVAPFWNAVTIVPQRSVVCVSVQ
ncbi:hypothetical protein B0H19DRAFT_1268826 [Mycena capillaripes]|nr:hypothetical protein B0H19DRAFT_1268826 [Mycena capillaripes]